MTDDEALRHAEQMDLFMQLVRDGLVVDLKSQADGKGGIFLWGIYQGEIPCVVLGSVEVE